jgi:hypothetical protein
MREELEDKIRAKYPKMFVTEMVERRDGTKYERKVCYDFSHGDGWYDLIDTLCGVIENEFENNEIQHKYRVERGEATEEDAPQPTIPIQIKEKFGGLRFYVNGGTPTIYGAIHMAESMSFRICEHCGNPGKTGGKGWIKTLCEPCRVLDERRMMEYRTQLTLPLKEKTDGQQPAERDFNEEGSGI